jgi:hypothetical protein
MFRNKALAILAVLVLALAIVAMACAPAAKPAPATPPASSTPPAATPPATPPTPPGGPTPTPTTPAPAAGKAASWGESNVFTSDQYGVSFQYPKSWVKAGSLSGDAIYIVLASTAQGADNANIAVIADSADVGAAVKASFEATPALAGLGVKMTIDSNKKTTLADGKTVATELVMSAKVMGIYDLYSYVLAISKGGKLIYAAGNTLGTDSQKAIVKEIAASLAVK